MTSSSEQTTAPDGDMTMGALAALIPNPGDTLRMGGMTVKMVGTFSYADEWVGGTE